MNMLDIKSENVMVPPPVYLTYIGSIEISSWAIEFQQTNPKYVGRLIVPKDEDQLWDPVGCKPACMESWHKTGVSAPKTSPETSPQKKTPHFFIPLPETNSLPLKMGAPWKLGDPELGFASFAGVFAVGFRGVVETWSISASTWWIIQGLVSVVNNHGDRILSPQDLGSWDPFQMAVPNGI